VFGREIEILHPLLNRAGEAVRRGWKREEGRSYAGRVERQVLVRSNDPKTPLLTVKVSATVEGKPGAKP
jgi:hypothetical protein